MRIHDIERNSDGQLPSFAWPGGYPIFYLVEDGADMCPDCANGLNGSDASVDHEDEQWNLVAADIYYEGPPLTCAHCDGQIESAYGDPEETLKPYEGE